MNNLLHRFSKTIFLISSCILLSLTACSLFADDDTPTDTPSATDAPEEAATAVTPTTVPLIPTNTPEQVLVDDTNGVINGRLWHDICINSGDPVDGCIVNSDGEYIANGLMETEEPAISDIIVKLGAGECPIITSGDQSIIGSSSDLLAATPTNGDGKFVFAGLNAGSYCLMINTLDEPNRDLLLPGDWTGGQQANRTITLAAGETVADANFGWDYTFRPVSEAELSCQDYAEFVDDVTISDNTAVSAGTLFTKTWRIRNAGTCSWTPAYALTFVEGHELEGPSILPLTRTVTPDETVDLTVQLTAPTYNDTFRSDWYLYNANKREFFGVFGDAPIWVIIVVEDAEDAAPITIPITETAVNSTPVTQTIAVTPAFANTNLSGTVWEDGNGDGTIGTDEAIYHDLTVVLYRDACPGSRVLATAVTNISGSYSFSDLAPGTYCIAIDATSSDNSSTLSSGDWTTPEAGNTTVQLDDGESATEINFGWGTE